MLVAVTVKSQKSKRCKSFDSIDKKMNPDTGCCCNNDYSIKCFSPLTHDSVNALTVLYDFKTKNIAFLKGNECLKRGDAIRIKVVNFNPFVYKVNIDNRDSSHNAIVDNGNQYWRRYAA